MHRIKIIMIVSGLSLSLCLFYDHLLIYANISTRVQKKEICTTQMHVVKQSFSIFQRFFISKMGIICIFQNADYVYLIDQPIKLTKRTSLWKSLIQQSFKKLYQIVT